MIQMRVVLDTDVMVAALRSRQGASRRIVQLVRQGQVHGIASVPLLFEYEAVMSRPEHLRASGARIADIAAILDVMASILEPVQVHFSWRPLLVDPTDDMVLEAAINGRADSIVTFNKRDYGLVPGRFGIEVLRPIDLLGRLR